MAFGFTQFKNFCILALLYAGKPNWRALDSTGVKGKSAPTQAVVYRDLHEDAVFDGWTGEPASDCNSGALSGLTCSAGRSPRARTHQESRFGSRGKPSGSSKQLKIRYHGLVASNDWTHARDAFEQAVKWFMRSVREGEGRWEEPALGEWSVRDLVGHTSRAMLTVEAYLGTPASEAEVNSAVEYFRRVLASSGDSAAIAQRGRDAGAALGEHPARAVAEISERVLARLHTQSGDALLTTPAGGMRLVDYLPTRTFELTVHTCDLAVALGVPLDVPGLSAGETLEVIGGLALRANLAGPLLLAATGRRPLPAGYTVL